MNKQMLVAGGGIGGLAAALAASRAGWEVRLYEQADAFGEVGAGVQLGPNVTRILDAWGLMPDLARVAAYPDQLQVFDGRSGERLGVLPLGERSVQRYGAPYVTIHRAALHALLLRAVTQQGGVWLKLNTAVKGFSQRDGVVALEVEGPTALPGFTVADPQPMSTPLRRSTVEGELLVGADGIWSTVRQQLLGDGPPAPTGHLAYRATVRQADLPVALRTGQVNVWLAPHLHAVAYPVSGGDALNVVVIVEGQVDGDLQNWDHAANVNQLRLHLRQHTSVLRDLVDAVPQWRLWPLHDRAPMHKPNEHGTGLVALLGDAAHPMLPYMAQGAGMAIEDAHALGQAFAMAETGVPIGNLLRHFAINRWERNARVQARSRRNGQIFHAAGPMRWGRNLGMRLLGERLMDVPWLYQGSTLA